MKINEALKNSTAIHEITGQEEKRVNDSANSGFNTHLKRIEAHNVEERLKVLVGRIEEQGARLGQRIDVRELKAYKKLISEFLDEALNNSHKFSKDSHLDRRGRFKVYATVKKINAELDELTKNVLSSEKDNIRILQRIEDIRGLILDLSL